MHLDLFSLMHYAMWLEFFLWFLIHALPALDARLNIKYLRCFSLLYNFLTLYLSVSYTILLPLRTRVQRTLCLFCMLSPLVAIMSTDPCCPPLSRFCCVPRVANVVLQDPADPNQNRELHQVQVPWHISMTHSRVATYLMPTALLSLDRILLWLECVSWKESRVHCKFSGCSCRWELSSSLLHTWAKCQWCQWPLAKDLCVTVGTSMPGNDG